jgi:hypothetical protein
MAIRSDLQSVKHFAKIYSYPDGSMDIIASTSPDFGEKGWENAENYGFSKALNVKKSKQERTTGAESFDRSMRRAKAQLRRLALSNDFSHFVTLTLDQTKVDRYDPAAIVRKLNAWCSNMVQRKGLKYILVPERHKDGAIHFHGFVNNVVEMVDSGHKDAGGHPIMNIPEWRLGFSTAIELYDEYHKAVGYVCKYIGKQGEKPAGRWYYSGGDLRQPAAMYANISPGELQEMYGEKCYSFNVPRRRLAIVQNVREQVQEEEDMEKIFNEEIKTGDPIVFIGVEEVEEDED